MYFWKNDEFCVLKMLFFLLKMQPAQTACVSAIDEHATQNTMHINAVSEDCKRLK